MLISFDYIFISTRIIEYRLFEKFFPPHANIKYLLYMSLTFLGKLVYKMFETFSSFFFYIFQVENSLNKTILF